MTRMFRVDFVNKESLNYIPELDNYVGKVLELNIEAGEQEYGVGLYTPDKSDWWYFDKPWVTEITEQYNFLNPEPKVKSPKHDVVNNPKHYQLVDGFEVKDLMKLLLNRIEVSDVGFTHFQSSCYKEAMQYFLRFMLKNGQEDIQKGVYYMNEVLKEWEDK